MSFIESILNRKEAPVEENKPRKEFDEITITGKIKNIQTIKKELEALSLFSQIETDKDILSAMIVESTDKDKKPHVYIRFSFEPKSVYVYYSIPPEISNPEIRRLSVSRSVFTVLALLEEKKAFIPDKAEMYSKIMESFELGENFDIDTLKIKYDFDRVSGENKGMKAELGLLRQEKEGLNHRLMELGKRSTQLEERVKYLEGMTNNELDREIIQWVEEHEGKLDEEGFCSSMNIPGTRLEERLNSLSKRRVIKIV